MMCTIRGMYSYPPEVMVVTPRRCPNGLLRGGPFLTSRKYAILVLSMEEQPIDNQIQQEPVNPVSPKSNYWLIATIILVVFIVIGGVYTLSLKSQKNTSIPSSIPPTTISQPSPTPEQTANWKTYINTKYGFSVKYPPNLISQEGKPSDLYLYSISFVEMQKVNPSAFSVHIETGTLETIVQSEKSGILGHIADEIKSESKIIKDGRDGVRLEYEFPRGAIEKPESKIENRTIIILSSGNYIYKLYSESDLIDQILSTLKFLGGEKVNKNVSLSEIWNPICEEKQLNNFEIKVRKGDGATDIARRALDAYLTALSIANIPNNVTLSSEERVYAEDYIRKNKNLANLPPGSMIGISCKLTEEASLKSRILTISQKQNLRQYSKNITQYQILDLINEIIEETTPQGGIMPQIFSP